MKNFVLKHSKVLKFSLWKVNLKLLGVLLFGGVLVGCTHRLGDFTVASTYNVQNLKYDVKDKKSAEGETCMRTIFWFTLGAEDDRLRRAVDDAIKNGREAGNDDGDLLVNVRIENTFINLFLYTSDCIEVTGDLVKISES